MCVPFHGLIISQQAQGLAASVPGCLGNWPPESALPTDLDRDRDLLTFFRWEWQASDSVAMGRWVLRAMLGHLCSNLFAVCRAK